MNEAERVALKVYQMLAYRPECGSDDPEISREAIAGLLLGYIEWSKNGSGTSSSPI